MKLWLSIIILALIGITLVSAQSYPYYCGGMMSGFYGGYGPRVLIFSWIFGLAVLVALILLIFWLIKQIQKK